MKLFSNNILKRASFARYVSKGSNLGGSAAAGPEKQFDTAKTDIKASLNRAGKLLGKKFNTRSAGLYCSEPVTDKQIQWADIVCVMEDSQRKEIANRFPKEYLAKQILSLDIHDVYHYNQPELITILKNKIDRLF